MSIAGRPAWGRPLRNFEDVRLDGAITYLNTDLDLASTENLTVLAARFETAGVHALHVTRDPDRVWDAIFETEEQHAEPQSNIAAMLAVIETLDSPLRSVWDACTLREFNIGYDCGAKPWAFNQGLSAELMGRMAAANASLRVTLYPGVKEVRGDSDLKAFQRSPVG